VPPCRDCVGAALTSGMGCCGVVGTTAGLEGRTLSATFLMRFILSAGQRRHQFIAVWTQGGSVWICRTASSSKRTAVTSEHLGIERQWTTGVSLHEGVVAELMQLTPSFRRWTSETFVRRSGSRPARSCANGNARSKADAQCMALARRAQSFHTYET
jgi:hypothetical protein